MCVLKYTQILLNQPLFSKSVGKLRERNRISVAKLVGKLCKQVCFKKEYGKL